MAKFIAQWSEQLNGTLRGFDRLVFRGHLRAISFVDGLMRYLRRSKVLLKEFGEHSLMVTRELKEAAQAEAKRVGRPVVYLRSACDKEAVARELFERNPIEHGLVCVLTAVEPCQTFEVYRNRETRHLELRRRIGKCLFLYHYWLDQQFGWMSARIQSWFPFPIQVCMNGRLWLEQKMKRRGMSYIAADNCFPYVEDWAAVQKMADAQRKTNWPKLLDRIAERLNPIHEQIFKADPVDYYWSSYQSEFAMDLVFKDQEVLKSLYQRMLLHGMTALGATDVLRYFGKQITLTGKPPKNFRGETSASFRIREEGARVKHSVNGNSVKIYDKAFTSFGSVLRVEATIQNGDDLRVYRPSENNPTGPSSWRPLRRGVADMERRTEQSEKAASRYLEAYASLEDELTLEQLLTKVAMPVDVNGRQLRALRPFDKDRQLITLIGRGDFALTGFRNRDIQAFFFPGPPSSPKEAKHRSAWASRQLRLLRAHGLITKIQKTHRYQITTRGRELAAVLLPSLRITAQALSRMAA
jgi:hypothetical protein